MSSPFRSLAGLNEFDTLYPIPQADPDQLICIKTTNPSNTNNEKVVSMTKKIAPEIVPCVPIYGIFRQTDTQIYKTIHATIKTDLEIYRNVENYLCIYIYVYIYTDVYPQVGYS